MAKGGEQAISVTFDVDTEQGIKNVKGLSTALQEAEGAAKNAEVAANAFSNIIGGIGKIATGAFGMVTAVLKAPVDLDNYLGQLNQKVTQVGGNLQSYKETFTKFLQEFKPGEGGFGLSDDDYKRVMMQFATGTTAVEKFGSAREANLKGYTQGSGMMMKTLGFDPTQAANLLTDLRKTVGLTAPDMEGFAQKMGNIGKSANMTSGGMYKLTKQVSGLAKAYNLSGKAGQQFITDSLQVGAAISQLGMDANSTIAKMNEVSTGSERGLIQSLLLGFTPGDAKGQLAAFENQAKMIVAQAAGAGAQFAPMVTRMMADAMGMEKFSVEDINRMASGIKTEGGKQMDATDILKEISETLKNPDRAAEKPFVTVAQTANNTMNALSKMMIEKFGPAISSLKELLTKDLPGLISKIGSWIDSTKNFLYTYFGPMTVGKLVAAAAALLAVPKIIGLAMGGITKLIISSLFKKGAGAAAEAVVGSAAHLLPKAAGLGANLLRFLPPVAIGTAIGGTIAYGMKKYGEYINDVEDRKLQLQDAEVKKIMTDKYNAALASGRKDKIASAERAMRHVGATPSSGVGALTLEDKIRGYAKKHNLPPDGFYAQIMHESGGGNPNAVSKAGAQGLGQLMPATSKGMGVTNPFDIDQNLEASASIMERLVKKYNGDYATALAAYNAGEGNVASGRAAHFKETQNYVAKLTPAYTGQKSGDLSKVHDESVVSVLTHIRDMIGQYLGAQPAVAGSVTSNMDNDAMVAQWSNGQR